MGANTPEKSALDRSRELRGPDRTGQEIATVLRDEGYELIDALKALLEDGHVATTEGNELHVSDQPSGAGLATLIMSAEPRALPSVMWES